MRAELTTRNELRAKGLIKALERRNMEASYAADVDQARDMVMSLLKPGSRIAYGGSMSLAEDTKILEHLRAGGFELIDRDRASSQEEAESLMRQAFSADSYLMGCNAISMDGQLVNVDGRGNRAAALIYGPRQVIILAGMNKVCENLDAAILRARSLASPANALRLGTKTPCQADGLCHDCLSPDCICCQVVLTRFSRVKGRIKIVLCASDLGL